MAMSAPPVVLTIAGFDPSSGAGVTADIKTIAAHGCYGISCITALTVQSTAGVMQVEPVRADLVRRTLVELDADLAPAAIHIGMLGCGAVAVVVADFLQSLVSDGRRTVPAVVLDPILASSSGSELLDAAGREVLRARLLPLATVVTPNLDEAAAISGVEVRTPEEMKAAALRLHQLGSRAVVVKGGHLAGGETMDVLSIVPSEFPVPLAGATSWLSTSSPPVPPERFEFCGARIDSRATHGTGCAFATALACNLALGSLLPEAVGAAKRYVANAIANAYPLGRGPGPMNHLYKMRVT